PSVFPRSAHVPTKMRPEVRPGLVPGSVFKTDGAPRKRRSGGFDSHALPLEAAEITRLSGSSPPLWPPLCQARAQGARRPFARRLACREDTAKVVVMLACPASSWIVLSGTPFSAKCE